MADEPKMMQLGKRSVLAGCWRDRNNRLKPPFRCQWFFSWTELDKGRIAGFMAGYEGGGAFVEEPFIACFKKKKLLEFVWHSREHISGDARPDMSFWPDEEVRKCCDTHADVLLQWHDNDEWENGYLCLASGREHTEGLILEPDCVFLAPDEDGAIDKIALLVAHTGITTRFC